MNMIRTTISLREDVYDSLRMLAATKRTTLSKVVNAKLGGASLSLNGDEIKQKIKENREFFRKLAKSTPKIDPVKAIREMRELRTNQIVGKV